MSEMLLERHKKRSFLHRIVTGDENSIHYNPKPKKPYVKPGQPAKSTAKPNIHGAKVMLCIWRGQKGVLYYELLKLGETINGEHYRTQLIRLKRAMAEKRPEYALGAMLPFQLRTIWKTVDGKFYPTRLIAQTLPLLTNISSGRCRTPSLEYGSHQNRVSKIGLIHSWPPSWRSSFGMESSNCQKACFRWAIL